jgi:hypothetical protein
MPVFNRHQELWKKSVNMPIFKTSAYSNLETGLNQSCLGFSRFSVRRNWKLRKWFLLFWHNDFHLWGHAFCSSLDAETPDGSELGKFF